MTTDEKLDLLINEVSSMKDTFNKRFESLEGRMGDFESRQVNVENGLLGLKLYIENKVEPQIKQVAEGVALNTERLNDIDKRTTEILDNCEILKVFSELAESKNKK